MGIESNVLRRCQEDGLASIILDCQLPELGLTYIIAASKWQHTLCGSSGNCLQMNLPHLRLVLSWQDVVQREKLDGI
ncbi:hypothetical protein M404DRAFT_541429 [Pisolithus tinctorius Marx 270]|uniref:Uncharacterized protein n=1 Tax=Pisolithus tinctorius Marx 270 TaxID=870435 RepID=A0A0C3K5M9_PISTI|nr:hypothetical protein M404DRAFT_541429 [Pisolithus tinctorius Marx 270]